MKALDTVAMALAFKRYRGKFDQYRIDHGYAYAEAAINFKRCQRCYYELQAEKKELLELIISFD